MAWRSNIVYFLLLLLTEDSFSWNYTAFLLDLQFHFAFKKVLEEYFRFKSKGNIVIDFHSYTSLFHANAHEYQSTTTLLLPQLQIATDFCCWYREVLFMCFHLLSRYNSWPPPPDSNIWRFFSFFFLFLFINFFSFFFYFKVKTFKHFEDSGTCKSLSTRNSHLSRIRLNKPSSKNWLPTLEFLRMLANLKQENKMLKLKQKHC